MHDPKLGTITILVERARGTGHPAGFAAEQKLAPPPRAQAPRQQRQCAKCTAKPHGDQWVLARLFHKHADGAQQHTTSNQQPLAVALAGATVGGQRFGGKGRCCRGAGWGVIHAADAQALRPACKTDKSNSYHSINEFEVNRP